MQNLEVPEGKAHRLFERGPPFREVLACKQARTGRERLDRLGHETLVEGRTSTFDLGLPPGAGCLALGYEAPERRRQGRVGKSAARWRNSAGQPDLRRARPVPPHVALDGRHGGFERGKHRKPRLRVGDRRLEHLPQRHRPEALQHQHEGAEGARDTGAEQPGAGHEIETELGEPLRRGGTRRRPLAVDDVHRVLAGTVEEHGCLATEAVLMRLDDLEHETCGGGGVEGVASPLEHRHAGLCGQPMRSRHHAEWAAELRPGGEPSGAAHRGRTS